MPTLDEENRTPISEISEPVEEEREERESLEVPQVDNERTEGEETPSEVEETPQESEQEESSSTEDEEQAPVLLGAIRSGSDDRIPISEMSELIQMNNDDLVVTVQTVNGVKTTFKAPLTLLASHLLKVMQFASDLDTTTKTIIGAINELAGGTGGASSLGELSDVTITSPSGGQVLTYDAVTGKWVNGAGAELALTGEVIGYISSFNDGSNNQPLKSWKTTITPIQAGSGTPSPSNVRALSGRTQVVATKTKANLLGGSKLLANAQAHLPDGTTDTVNKTFTYSATSAITSGTTLSQNITFKENTRYTFIFTLSGTSPKSNMRIYYKDGTYSAITNPTTANTKETIVYTSNANKTIDYLTKYAASGYTTIYYDESGVFEGIVTAEDFEAYDADSRTISLGATVLGGELDIKNGIAKSAYAKITFDGSETWVKSGNSFRTNDIADALNESGRNLVWCEQGEYLASGIAENGCWLTSKRIYFIPPSSVTDATAMQQWVANNNLTFVYPVATPTTLTTQEEEFNTSEGINQFYTDCGISDVVYFNSMVDDVVDICNEVVDSKVKVLTGTLTAGNTTITFTDNSLTSDCTKTLYVDDAFFGVAPTAMTPDYANHSVTYTFPVQASNMPVKLEVK